MDLAKEGQEVSNGGISGITADRSILGKQVCFISRLENGAERVNQEGRGLGSCLPELPFSFSLKLVLGAPHHPQKLPLSLGFL